MNCLVAIGGDLQNKAPRINVSVPELMLLRLIHGEASVSDITVTGNPRITQLEERDKLLRAYPKYQQVTHGLWRDNGGEFPKDVRRLELPAALFAPDRTAPYDAADAIEAAEEAEIKKAKAPAKRKSRAKSKVTVAATPPPETEHVPGGDDEYQHIDVPGETESEALL